MSRRSIEPDLLESMRTTLYAAVLSDILDEMGIKDRVAQPGIRPLWPGAVVVGTAFTVSVVDVDRVPERPYEGTLAAVDRLKPGDVLVADARQSEKSAFWGELLSTAAARRGASGAVIDGLSRDVRRVAALRFPVFARGSSPLDSKGRLQVERIGGAVQCGGVLVEPGDLVFGDEDGLVVVPGSAAAEAVERAFRKVAAERDVRAALESGLSATEAYKQYRVL